MDENDLQHNLVIMGRLDVIEKNIEQIASFLRTKSSTLGETFPEQQHRKAREEIEGHKPDRHFIGGVEQSEGSQENTISPGGDQQNA